MEIRGESPCVAIEIAVAVLVYETEDADFVERALQELIGAGISCHRCGPATVGDESYRGRTGAMAGIYIERDSDYRAANEILIIGVDLGSSDFQGWCNRQRRC